MSETLDERLALAFELDRDDDWLPIATAPKDGSELLLKFHGCLAIGHTNDFECTGWWFSSPKQIDDGWETPFGSIGEPTHWMARP